MSGATEKTLSDPGFELYLSTPCISFAMDPETGESPEMAFHQRAAARMEAYFSRVHQPLAAALDRFFAEEWAGPTRVPFDGSLPMLTGIADVGRSEIRAHRCGVTLLVPRPDMAQLTLCFAARPTVAEAELLKAALDRIFTDLE